MKTLTRERAAELEAEDSRLVAEAEAAYDAALEAAIQDAMERHHIDRNSAWWIAKGMLDVKVGDRYIDRAYAGASIRARWRKLNLED